MIKRGLVQIASGRVYGGEKLCDRLWDEVTLNSELGSKASFDGLCGDFEYLLGEAVDSRFPGKYRMSDIRHVVKILIPEGFLESPVLPLLDDLCAQLLRRHGDLLCYREEAVLAYGQMAAELDPGFLAAWHLSGWVMGGKAPGFGAVPAGQDIRRVVSAQAPFFAPPGNPALPFAEGHVHYGGVASDNLTLGDLIFHSRPFENNKTGKRDLWRQHQIEELAPLLARARQLLTLVLADAKAIGEASALATRLEGWRDPMARPGVLPDWQWLRDSVAHAAPASADWLLGEVAGAMMKGEPNRWLWLNLYLASWYRRESAPPMLRVIILCWWQTINLLRRSLIMEGQGLTRFAERYYSAPLKKAAKRDDRGVVRWVFPERGDLAEVKGSAFSSDFAVNLSTGLAANAQVPVPQAPYIFGEQDITPDGGARAYTSLLESWQFCHHFSRTKDIGRDFEVSRDRWQEAEEILRLLQSTAGWNRPEFLGGRLNPHFQFLPGRWFRGLDVAGDENRLKIEWFAPVFRWMRQGFLARPEGEPASSGFHLSIHTGEDYAHPASGLRHVDETVHFCEMREGDRLGHGLALGVDPRDWVKRQDVMILPVDEHLDNLVWLWHYATELSARLPLAQQVLPGLTRRIARFYRECSWWRGEAGLGDVPAGGAAPSRYPLWLATPETLYRAWWLRRNCYYRYVEAGDGFFLTSLERAALPDWEDWRAGQHQDAFELYRVRHSHLASGVSQRRVLVRAGEGGAAARVGFGSDFLEDTESAADLKFMHALQDYLLDSYDARGLIIETNPTSNVYIARLNGYGEHPIFRWNPPDQSVLAPGAEANLHGLRRGPIRVTVNTDDPGIMPTTLRTEFLLLREAALAKGIGRTTAERWLEDLRRFGMEQFHRNHLPVFEPVAGA